MYDYMRNKPEICRNGFRKAGIAEAIETEQAKIYCVCMSLLYIRNLLNTIVVKSIKITIF